MMGMMYLCCHDLRKPEQDLILMIDPRDWWDLDMRNWMKIPLVTVLLRMHPMMTGGECVRGFYHLPMGMHQKRCQERSRRHKCLSRDLKTRVSG